MVLLVFGAVDVQARPQSNRFQHIAVIENDAWEQSLPSELRNPFYKTPRVREALAKASWFGPGEMPVSILGKVNLFDFMLKINLNALKTVFTN